MKKMSEVKVLFIGDSGVGKTSLLHSYVDQKFTQNHKATIGADIVSKSIFTDGKEVQMQIWDTAGQETFNSMGNIFYRGADCCVIVYDITNSTSFQNVNRWKENFLQEGRIDNPSTFPLFLVGNKIDRESERNVSLQQVTEFLTKNSTFHHYETSARNNSQTEEFFNHLGRAAYQSRKKQEEIFHPIITPITLQKSKKNKKGQKRLSNCGRCRG